jgi:hypothetical protein
MVRNAVKPDDYPIRVCYSTLGLIAVSYGQTWRWPQALLTLYLTTFQIVGNKWL